MDKEPCNDINNATREIYHPIRVPISKAYMHTKTKAEKNGNKERFQYSCLFICSGFVELEMNKRFVIIVRYSEYLEHFFGEYAVFEGSI